MGLSEWLKAPVLKNARARFSAVLPPLQPYYVLGFQRIYAADSGKATPIWWAIWWAPRVPF